LAILSEGVFKRAFRATNGCTTPLQCAKAIFRGFQNLCYEKQNSMGNDWLNIRLVQETDFPFLSAQDPHILGAVLRRKIAAREVLVAVAGDEPIGYLRWGWFWDAVPFMNLLFVLEAWRGKRVATQLIAHWEGLMQAAGAAFVLTSTLADETAQHLYRKCGYRDIGGFVLPNEPLELILFKQIRTSK
jgi:GNAT superfamily N-acetyltransferase